GINGNGNCNAGVVGYGNWEDGGVVKGHGGNGKLRKGGKGGKVNAGMLHSVDELLNKVAWQEDLITGPSVQSSPSTEGISSLYTPYLSVVLFTEKVMSSSVLGESALNLHCI
ncbi:hypothetical protein AKJ16_DCAP02113, partial [Drosera capensis]